MERAGLANNNRLLFRLIKQTGTKRIGVSETITERDGSSIHSQQRRPHRWAEHFEEQFNFPEAHAQLPALLAKQPWMVDCGPPTMDEVNNAIKKLMRFKSAGPDGPSPFLFKEGGDLLLHKLTELFHST